MTINYLNCQWNKHVATFLLLLLLSLLLVKDAPRFTRPDERLNFSPSPSPSPPSSLLLSMKRKLCVPRLLMYHPTHHHHHSLQTFFSSSFFFFYTQVTCICTSCHCSWCHRLSLSRSRHRDTKVQSQSIKYSYSVWYLLVSGQESAMSRFVKDIAPFIYTSIGGTRESILSVSLSHQRTRCRKSHSTHFLSLCFWSLMPGQLVNTSGQG